MLSLNIQGEKVVLRLISIDIINGIIDFYDRNRERVSKFNPAIPSEYFSSGFWEHKAKYRNSSLKREHAMDLMVSLPEYPDRVIGHIRIFNIEPSPRYSCEIGYTIDGILEGRGYMREAIFLALSFIKDGLGLHRVTAICHPENIRSKKLLTSLDFKEEGVLHESISMNNEWHDMDLFYCLLIDRNES